MRTHSNKISRLVTTALIGVAVLAIGGLATVTWMYRSADAASSALVAEAVATTNFAPGEKRGLRSGSYVVLRVGDTGPGMAPEVAARALDPMFSTRGSSIHFGWGLSNCAGFLRQSGGALGISSRPGRGTTVEALLPADLMASRHVA